MLYGSMGSKKVGVYLLISLLVTSLDLALLFLLLECFELHYLLGASISYSSAVITKFALNKISIFKSVEGIWFEQLARFWIVSLSGLALTNLGMYVGVDIIGLSYFFSKLGCIGLVFIWTFILHNVFSFKSNVTSATCLENK